MISWGDAFSNRKSGLMGMTGILNQNSRGAGCVELTKMPDRFWSNVNYFWLEDTHLLSFFRLFIYCIHCIQMSLKNCNCCFKSFYGTDTSRRHTNRTWQLYAYYLIYDLSWNIQLKFLLSREGSIKTASPKSSIFSVIDIPSMSEPIVYDHCMSLSSNTIQENIISLF